jgi:Protein of unknown function with HXXEE motif
MMQFILRNTLNLMALLGAGVVVYLAIFWHDMPVMQRTVGLIFLALVCHVWEEMRYPGGFAELMMSRLNFAIPNMDVAHAIVAAYVLYLVFVPLFFPHLVWLAMASMVLGVLEAVAHVAMIKILRLKLPYSPGLATAIVLLLPISLFGITYVVRNDLMQPWEWAYSLLYMIVGLAIAQGTVVRMSGLKYGEFLKRVRSTLFRH